MPKNDKKTTIRDKKQKPLKTILSFMTLLKRLVKNNKIQTNIALFLRKHLEEDIIYLKECYLNDICTAFI